MWLTLSILVLRRLRQEDGCEIKDSLSYTVRRSQPELGRPCLKSEEGNVMRAVFKAEFRPDTSSGTVS